MVGRASRDFERMLSDDKDDNDEDEGEVAATDGEDVV